MLWESEETERSPPSPGPQVWNILNLETEQGGLHRSNQSGEVLDVWKANRRECFRVQ